MPPKNTYIFKHKLISGVEISIEAYDYNQAYKILKVITNHTHDYKF